MGLNNYCMYFYLFLALFHVVHIHEQVVDIYSSLCARGIYVVM